MAIAMTDGQTPVIGRYVAVADINRAITTVGPKQTDIQGASRGSDVLVNRNIPVSKQRQACISSLCFINDSINRDAAISDGTVVGGNVNTGTIIQQVVDIGNANLPRGGGICRAKETGAVGGAVGDISIIAVIHNRDISRIKQPLPATAPGC